MPNPLDAANAQHMRAMGLDPELLGQKFDVPHNARSTNEDNRCLSTNEDGDQCARRTGHDGVHARGYARWDNPEDQGEGEEDGSPKEDPDAG